MSRSTTIQFATVVSSPTTTTGHSTRRTGTPAARMAVISFSRVRRFTR